MATSYCKDKKKSLDQSSPGYLISAVSREVNLSQKTIRDYEKMGLIKPMRAPRTNNRIYSDFDLAQIRQISYLIHNEGFTLPSLRRLFQLAPCWRVFDCKGEKCSAYKCSDKFCYEIRETEETRCNDSCDRCAIYISRSSKRKRILENPMHMKR